MNLHKSEKPLALSGFLIKVFAFLFMTLDHIGVFLSMKGGFSEAADVLRYLGRLAFPLFVFLLAEGMRLSHRRGRYLLRTGLAWAVITLPETLLVYIPAFSSAIGYGPGNLDPHPFTDIFFLCLLLYCLTLKGWKKAFAVLPAAFFIFCFYLEYFDSGNPYLPYYLRSGYNLFGMVLALAFFAANVALDKWKPGAPRLLRNIVNIACLGFVVLVCYFAYAAVGFEGKRFMEWEIYALFSGLFLLLYSGKRGYDAPWWRVFSYSYFLLHMAVLYVIFALIP